MIQRISYCGIDSFVSDGLMILDNENFHLFHILLYYLLLLLSFFYLASLLLSLLSYYTGCVVAVSTTNKDVYMRLRRIIFASCFRMTDLAIRYRHAETRVKICVA